MPNILESGLNAAKAEANKAALDFDAKGNIEGSVHATKQFKKVTLTFTGYLKALVKGPQKSMVAGGRIEADF